jgi:hypothetical protein
VTAVQVRRPTRGFLSTVSLEQGTPLSLENRAVVDVVASGDLPRRLVYLGGAVLLLPDATSGFDGRPILTPHALARARPSPVPDADQVALKLRQATPRGVGPGVTERTESGLFVGNGRAGVQQIPCRPRQPVQLGGIGFGAAYGFTDITSCELPL